MASEVVSKDSYDPMIKASSSNRKAKDGAWRCYSAYRMIEGYNFMNKDATT